jgi:signal transduction histidine kinase
VRRDARTRVGGTPSYDRSVPPDQTSQAVSGPDAQPVIAPPSVRMTAYALLLAGIAMAIIVWGGAWQYAADALYWVPVLAVAYLTMVSTVPGLALDSSLGAPATIATAILYPPSAVTLFTLIGAMHWRELRGEAPLVMALFNRGMLALSGALASIAAAWVFLVLGDGTWQLFPAAILAAVAYDGANTLLLAVMLVVRRGQTWRRALHEAANPFPRFAANTTGSAMLSLLVVVLVRDVGYWAIVLMAVPLWLSHSAQRSAREAQDRADELVMRVRELEMLNRLSGDLLTARSTDQVQQIATTALESAVGGIAVQVDLAGPQGVDTGTVIPIGGSGRAGIVIADVIDGPARAVLEAAASLLGLTLTRLELERELAETERARTALTARILEEATHERSRIAMEVHDDVLPLFAAAQMQIDNAEMLIAMHRHDSASQVVDKATRALSDGIRALRDTLEALRQSTLVPGTVVDGVRKLLADLQARTGIRSTLEVPDPMRQLPFAVELLAYETIRGTMANVEKHAAASTVHVEFRDERGRLVIVMRDDGQGFDPAMVGTRSHGLALMRQRAELARGSFDISGTPGQGTTVRLEVPTW